MKAGPRIKVTKDGPYEVHNIDRIMRYQIIPDDEGGKRGIQGRQKVRCCAEPGLRLPLRADAPRTVLRRFTCGGGLGRRGECRFCAAGRRSGIF